MSEYLVIEDHGYIADATQRVIKEIDPAARFTFCSTASQAKTELEKTPTGWTRILLDLNIPGAVGLSLAMEIQRKGLAPITCILTGNSDYIAQAQAHGFQGYVVKDISTKDLAQALARIVEGEQIYPDRHKGGEGDAVMRLTTRQIQCLELVGKKTKGIAQALHLSPATVNDHINAAMAALGVNSRAHAVQKAIQLGLLRLRDDNADDEAGPEERAGGNASK
jgi:DNA-binding NarL/FixJ family response regulator